MSAIKLSSFGGMIPAMDQDLIPGSAAALCYNVWLYDGTIQPLREQTLLHTLVDPIARRVYRLPNNGDYARRAMADSDWLEFQNTDTDVVRSPIANDAFERYYWMASSHEPYYNTRQRITDGDPPLTLGVPQPATAPGLGTTVVGGGLSVSRAYVYTYVTEFGEEGPPSSPSLLTGAQDDQWDLTFADPGVDPTKLIDTIRVYRTVTSSQGVATYFFVADVLLPTLTYADVITDTIVTGNNQLQSTGYTPPGVQLEGMVAMPNGMIAAFTGNEVWFCEPYLPHAWPAAYTVSFDQDIVGLGVVGQTLVVLTRSVPYVMSGTRPDNMSQAKINQIEPCMCRGSIVSTPVAVYYASPNGLISVGPSGLTNITKQMVGKKMWDELLTPDRMSAAVLNEAYYCWGFSNEGAFDPIGFEPNGFNTAGELGAYKGAMIDPGEQRVSYVALKAEDAVWTARTDDWNGEICLVRDGGVYLVDVSNDTVTFGSCLWRSKRMQLPQQKNLGVMRVFFDVPDGTPALNEEADTDLVQVLVDGQYGLMRLYADDVLVWTRELRTSGEMMKLPKGFSADYWQVEYEGRVIVKSIELGSSAKDLGRV